MRAIVLGSAAGGGFPQWNCACPGCTAVREGRPGWTRRTQDAIAVTSDGDGARFALLNASPDLLAQIHATRALWPRGPRHTPIGAVVLTNGDLDHVLGLFSLRESQPLALYATRAVYEGLSASVFLRTLERFEGQLVYRPLPLDRAIELADASGAPLGLEVRATAAPGKLPVHLAGRAEPSAEDNVALAVRETGARASIAYATACAIVTPEIEDALGGHAALFFDGTFYTDDELVRLGLSRARAKDMAHAPIGGPAGSLARFARGAKMRRIYTHINNTNPILAPESDERRAVLDAGWEIAFDGMEVDL